MKAATSTARSILIVEDDMDIRDTLAETLRDEGYEVTTAANGKQALDCVREATQLPNLILLDLMMPVMDGRQFRYEQLEDPKIATIPVIILSAHGDLRSVTADEYVRKPIELERLLTLTARFCSAS